jgi:hypothetical protein
VIRSICPHDVCEVMLQGPHAVQTTSFLEKKKNVKEINRLCCSKHLYRYAIDCRKGTNIILTVYPPINRAISDIPPRHSHFTKRHTTHASIHTTHALSQKRYQRHLRYSSEMPTVYQNYLVMRNTGDGKPIAIKRLRYEKYTHINLMCF